MTIEDKRELKKKKYINKLKAQRDAYADRKEYIKDFELPKTIKQKIWDAMKGIVGGNKEESSGEGNDGDKNGDDIQFIEGDGTLICPCEKGTYRFTSKYGNRSGGFHYGIDLAPKTKNDPNCKFYAAGDGVVIEARGGVGGFGSWIVIKHKEDLYTIYGHMKLETHQVKKGDKVKKGQYIAKMGNEGVSYGVHLHFETMTSFYSNRRNSTFDPEKMIDVRSGASAVQTRAYLSQPEEPMGNEEPMEGEVAAFKVELDEDGKDIDMSTRSFTSYKKIEFKKGKINPFKNREETLIERIGYNRKTAYRDLRKINPSIFRHVIGEENLYSPDAIYIFHEIVRRLKKEYVTVLSGFRKSEEGRLSPHEAGCAIDVMVKDLDEALFVMDTCWELGIKGMCLAGKEDEKNLYVHIDILYSEKPLHKEGMPKYIGPGRWEM